jgi:multimeric flavodoxin WrbA
LKVLAFNSSPKKDKGNTSLILKPFLDGMKEAGADVELLYTKDLKINPCQGEFNCWLKTPGHCFQQDDMQMIYPKLSSDVIVFATPLYVDGINASMKNIMDRMLPIVEPFIELHEGHCRHPSRDKKIAEQGKVVLVSTCGFWEIDNFDSIIFHIKAICLNMPRKFAGALLRPHCNAFQSMLAMGAPVKDILEAAQEAGRQLVKNGKMSEKTLNTISRELIPRETFIQMANQTFTQVIEAAQKS